MHSYASLYKERAKRIITETGSTSISPTTRTNPDHSEGQQQGLSNVRVKKPHPFLAFRTIDGIYYGNFVKHMNSFSK